MSSLRVRSSYFKLAALIGALLAVMQVGLPAVAQSTSATVDLAEARYGHTATLLPDQTVLIVGGFDGENELGSVERVDPRARVAAPSGMLTTARSGHTATLLPDGRVLIAGGAADGTSLAGAELFDPATGASALVGALKWARAEHAAALLDDGRVLLVGGVADGRPVARAELYDPATGSFTPAAKPRAIHRGATATPLANGKVLVTGTATRKKAPAAELYDPAKDTWSAIKRAPAATGHAATGLRDGRVLLVGGSGKRSQLYDPAKGRFAGASALTAPRSGHTATPLLFGEVLIVGGTQDQEEVSAIELLDSEADTVEVIGDLMIPRAGHTTTALSDGGALVVGGEWAGLALEDVLYLHPDTYELAPLGGVSELAEPAAVARTRADVLAELGAPDAFLVLYPNYTEDPATEPLSIETWTWYGTGTELTFEGDALVAEDSVDVVDDVLAAPYESATFDAWMSLDEVIAAAGVVDYYGGPLDEAESTELWFAPQLAWGLKDGRLVFIEGIALGAGEDET